MMILDPTDDGASATGVPKKKIDPVTGATDVNGQAPADSPQLTIPPIDTPAPASTKLTPDVPTDTATAQPTSATLPDGPAMKNDGSPFNIVPPDVSTVQPVSDVPPMDVPPAATETPAFAGSNEPVGAPTSSATIDPSNDLRNKNILPGDDPGLDSAIKGTQDATAALNSFDRQGVVDSLLGKNAGPDVPDIAPEDDMRAKVISDAPDARTAGYTSKVDAAASALPTDVTGRSNALRDEYLAKAGPTDVNAGPDISLAASDRLNKYGSMLDQSVAGLNGVDRVKMAQDLYDIFQEQQAPARAAAERKAKQFAAATGGLRSGRLRTAEGDLMLANKREDNLTQRQLIAQALSDSVNDQYNKAGFLRDTEGDLAAREAANRGELRTDRAYKSGIDEGNVNRRLSTLGTATDAGRTGAGLESDAAYKGLDTLRSIEGDAAAANATRVAGQRAERANQFALSDRKRSNFESNRANANAGADAASNEIARRIDANRSLYSDANARGVSNRNEARTERDNQNLMENQAFQRRVAQYQTESGAKQQEFQNALALISAGEYGNPADVLAKLSQEGGLDPAMIAALAQSLGNKGTTAPAASGKGLPAGVTDLGHIDDILKSLAGAHA